MKYPFAKMLCVISLIFTCIGAAGCMKTVDSTTVKAVFAEPPREYSTGPLWVWNDMLTEEQVVSTLRDLAGQKVMQAFIHPRVGLMTPYLSPEWFRLWKIALNEAEWLDMNIWIYDENSYPSGFAGGFVPDAMPQSRGQSVAVREEKLPPKWSDDIIAVYRLKDGSYENVTKKVHRGQKMPESRYLVAHIEYAKDSVWFAGKFYVNLIYPGVTEKFLDITMNGYRFRFSEQFGKRVPGVFTDEPHLKPVWGQNHTWTVDFDQVFERRWGYKLTDHLPSLARPLGDWKRVRHNYFQVLLELEIERWAKPYYNYCQENGLEFTGHYWEHKWPNCLLTPDNMAMYYWQHRPGIDNLFNQYREDTHAQFGNIRAVKELASVANQLGKGRTLCEAYGGAGWELRFEDMKRIGDWLYVLGVNTLNEHLSFITICGHRKFDYPQSFSYHEPWWDAYHVMASYFTRLSAALSQGEQINKVLLIEPTTTVWMYQIDPNHSIVLDKVGEQFQNIVVALAKAQVEFDIGSEYIIAQRGLVKGRKFKIGQRKYDTVVLPPLIENLNTETVNLLEAYLKAGGFLICCGKSIPKLVDGQPSNRCYAALHENGYTRVEPNDLPEILVARSKDGFAICRNKNDQGLLLHHRRQLNDGELLFLTNTSIDSSTCGVIKSAMQSTEHWNLESGTISPYPFKPNNQGIEVDFELAPCGSLLLFLSKKMVEPTPSVVSKISTIPFVGPLNICRLESNVLTLNYVDVTAGNETKKNIYCLPACKFVFQKNGLEDNPWGVAIQFRDEFITKKFGPESGFEASYRFVIEDRVPEPLYIVIERPDLYTITCNGTEVSAEKGLWWLDKSFEKIDITAAAKVGENTVTIKASPMTVYHELEPAYVLGSFALKPADSGFAIVPESPLTLGPWDQQGHPFYAAGVSYSQSFDVPQLTGQYHVRLPDWYGSVAKVIVNSKLAGHIYHQPYQCDVAKYITAGTNTIEVIAIGTLKNALGPNLGNFPKGQSGPLSFWKAPESGPPPGSEYQTAGYGLFKSFELLYHHQ